MEIFFTLKDAGEISDGKKQEDDLVLCTITGKMRESKKTSSTSDMKLNKKHHSEQLPIKEYVMMHTIGREIFFIFTKHTLIEGSVVCCPSPMVIEECIISLASMTLFKAAQAI